MKIIFFGTPEYVLPILDSLHNDLKTKKGKSPIVAVVTQPPKPTGRKQKLEYSPVDTWAYKKSIQIIRNLDINSLPSADLGILASYGKIIPEMIIKYFPFGILNIHPSLLPLWRGSSPVQATIISGEKAGVTVIKVDEKLDHGPIVSQFTDQVLPEDTTESLRKRLFERSAQVLTTLIPAFIQGKITLHQQKHQEATFTREIKKEDAFVPSESIESALLGITRNNLWQIPFMRLRNNSYTLYPTPYNLNNFIRAMQPWPQAWTKIRIKNKELRLKILNAHLKKTPEYSQLILDKVQLEGKNPVTWKQFKEGYPEAKFI
mgnify:FL=1